MNHMSFTISGDPFGKERPRATVAGKFARFYTPPKTKKYEARVAKAFSDEYPGCVQDAESAFVVAITAYYTMPKGLSKVKRAAMDCQPCLKMPDCDNVAKIILDGLNGLPYKDDKQVANLRVSKRWSDVGEVYVSVYAEDNE